MQVPGKKLKTNKNDYQLDLTRFFTQINLLLQVISLRHYFPPLHWQKNKTQECAVQKQSDSLLINKKIA